MGKALPYYKMYPADAETDENFRAMNDTELGFYWRCLNHAWINGSLPADPENRARTLRTTRRTADKLWDRVGKCFIETEDDHLRLVNRRQEEERDRAISKSEKNSSVASLSQKKEPGSVYLAKRESDGAVKIGSSNNVPRRFAQLKYRYRGESLTMVLHFKVPDMLKAETEIHSAFSGKRVQGEWYALSPEDIQAITLRGDTNYHPRGDSDNHPGYHPLPHALGRADYDYESDSVVVSDLKPENRKSSPRANGEWEHGAVFGAAWSRWGVNRKTESLQSVVQVLIGMNGDLDWDRFVANYPPWCDYWDRHEWKFSGQSLLEWVRNGCKLPPPEPLEQQQNGRSPGFYVPGHEIRVERPKDD